MFPGMVNGTVPQRPTKTKKATLKFAIKRVSIKFEGDEQAFGDLIATYAAGMEDGKRFQELASTMVRVFREMFAKKAGEGKAAAASQTGESPSSPGDAS